MTQNDRPVIDAIYQAILNSDDAELARIRDTRHAECAGIRALICTDDPGAIDLDLGLGLGDCEFVTPIFEGPRARLLSRPTTIQERFSGGNSNVPIDFSLAFDSNFADKLLGVIEGRNLDPIEHNRVLDPNGGRSLLSAFPRAINPESVTRLDESGVLGVN